MVLLWLTCEILLLCQTYMILHSTTDKSLKIDFTTGVTTGLAPDGALLMPDSLPRLPKAFFRNIAEMTLNEIAFVVANTLVGDEFEADVLKHVIDEAITFDMPLVKLTDNRYVLELFHGPTLSFKDIGARCMARFLKIIDQRNHECGDILVATSGDSGGAVADAFRNIPECRVYVLFPMGELSRQQIAQFASIGNVTPIEVDGTFDDCQHLVKDVLLKQSSASGRKFTSGNSINLARELPSLIYFFYAYARAIELHGEDARVAISIPCGNLGSFCAALMAKRMGLPVEKFIAANNANDVFVEYLKTGGFRPQKALVTLARAMDVGNPSNLARIVDLYDGDISLLRNDVEGYVCSDQEIAETMKKAYELHNYIIDPQGATALGALMNVVPDDVTGIAIASAHPAKSSEVVKDITGVDAGIPERFAELVHCPIKTVKIPPTTSALKRVLAI